MATTSESRIRCDIDLDATGRQAGYLRAPHSRNTAGWGTVEIPIVSVKNGTGPTVLFTGFGANSLDFSVRAWTDSFDDSVFVRSGMAVGIHAALAQAGIEIPFPQRDLHVKSIDADILAQLKRGDS